MEDILLNQIKDTKDSNMKLDFGMYAGRDVRSVPWAYLWWLYDNKVEVSEAISCYIISIMDRLEDYMDRRGYDLKYSVDGPGEEDIFSIY